jgi:Ethanolamine utilization protein EutJ (predicted chaperonin)
VDAWADEPTGLISPTGVEVGSVHGSVEEAEEFRRANPKLEIVVPFCGNPAAKREAELEARRIRRPGLSGRLRLAWNRHVVR